MSRAYIVPSTLLIAAPPLCREWHATPIPSDPTQSLLVVIWNDGNAEGQFESQHGVLPLGDPWEELPAEAAPLLASFQGLSAVSVTGAIPTTDPPTPDPSTPDTVGAALRKVPAPWVKLVR